VHASEPTTYVESTETSLREARPLLTAFRTSSSWFHQEQSRSGLLIVPSTGFIVGSLTAIGKLGSCPKKIPEGLVNWRGFLGGRAYGRKRSSRKRRDVSAAGLRRPTQGSWTRNMFGFRRGLEASNAAGPCFECEGFQCGEEAPNSCCGARRLRVN